ncbi:hypothetical protein VCSRO2_3060 [Vibrio cholerae]|nr:hypothetical protein Sa5Y_VC00071 [Vibrio cholerae]GHX01577.1 hypothetical protein VCSRO2_3060 [Vibrio cholerae]
MEQDKFTLRLFYSACILCILFASSILIKPFGIQNTMSLTTYEMARILEQLDESPEKVMYGKLLNELGNQSSERIRSAAKQVPLTVLRDLVYQFQQVIESRKGEQVETMAKELAKQGISAEELLNYLQKR